MARILAIKSVKSKSGKPFVLLTTSNGDVWIPYGQWSASNSVNLQSYVGGEIAVMYFKKGDTLLSGTICEVDNVIVDSFIASQNPRVLALVEAELVQQGADDMALLAMQARKKRLATAVTASNDATKAEQPAESAENATPNVEEPAVETPAVETTEEEVATTPAVETTDAE